MQRIIADFNRRIINCAVALADHSTVTDFAKFLGWSTSVPFAQAAL
jgi:hypothetical protein